jgi:hypothetical protein
MSAAYHGGLIGSTAAQWTKSDTIQTSISAAMNWWFQRDFAVDACLDEGGEDSCPCGTPGLWNTNWNANVRPLISATELIADVGSSLFLTFRSSASLSSLLKAAFSSMKHSQLHNLRIALISRLELILPSIGPFSLASSLLPISLTCQALE